MEKPEVWSENSKQIEIHCLPVDFFFLPMQEVLTFSSFSLQI